MTDLRYQTANIIKILQQNQPVVVTRDNDTVAVMLSPKQYQQIFTFFERLEDQKAAERLEKAIEKGGQFIDFHAFDTRQRKELPPHFKLYKKARILSSSHKFRRKIS